jgi:hypothetical protein
MRLTTDDFASGRFDEYFKLVNQYSDSSNKFTPYTNHAFTKADYDRLAKHPQLIFIISSWQANVGQNGAEIVLSVKDDNSDQTKYRKDLIKKRVYSLIFSKHKWQARQQEIIKLVAVEGNAVLMINDEGKAIIESIFRFNVYWDNVNKRARYAYKIDGREVPGMQDMRHGVDLWHFKDSVFQDLPVAPSRIDAAIAYLLLENKGLRLNIHLFAKGWFSNIFLKLNPEMLPKLKDEKKDEKGKTWIENWIQKINDKFSGTDKAGSVAYVPGLEGLLEIGKSNKDSQFNEMMKELTPERIGWAFSMVATDFGAGGATTYNNVSVFNDALFDKVGRNFQLTGGESINEFLLPVAENVITTEYFYFCYLEPEDPNRLEETKQWREDWINNALTFNEYREKRGLASLPGGDVTYSQYVSSFAPTLPDNSTDTAFTLKKNSTHECGVDCSHTNIEFKKKTRTEKLFASKEYKKFQTRWQKAIAKQAEALKDKLEKLDDEDLEDYKVKLDKIESFYAFNVLRDDLLVFAGKALDSLKKVSQIKFVKEFFDGEYPKAVLDAIIARTEFVLKGDGTFAGVDEETTKQISNFIADNASLGVVELTKKLVDFIPGFSENRARIIAETEVANASEGTRLTMYEQSGAIKKKLRTVNDSLVRSSHSEAQSLGWVDIDYDYGGFTRGGQEPRCRCDTDYLFEGEKEN